MAEQQTINITPEQLQQMMKTLAETIVRGDPDVALQKEEDKKRKAAQKKSMMEAIEAARQNKIAAQANCNHKKNDGKDNAWSTGGQVFGDNNVGIICTRCQSFWKMPLSNEQRRMIDSGDVSLSEIAPPDSKYLVN